MLQFWWRAWSEKEYFRNPYTSNQILQARSSDSGPPNRGSAPASIASRPNPSDFTASKNQQLTHTVDFWIISWQKLIGLVWSCLVSSPRLWHCWLTSHAGWLNLFAGRWIASGGGGWDAPGRVFAFKSKYFVRPKLDTNPVLFTPSRPSCETKERR